jgi:hypothetical protein
MSLCCSNATMFPSSLSCHLAALRCPLLLLLLLLPHQPHMLQLCIVLAGHIT